MMRKSNLTNVLITFFKLGLTSFGGPIAHIAYFRKELIEKQQWTNEHQFSQLLAICQFLPGPASSQLGFALGFMRAGWLGALAAFIAFTLPSALLLIGFASLLPLLSNPVGMTVIHGLKLVAVAVVADAVLGMAKKLCPDHTRRIIALLAASALLVTQVAWAQILVIIVGAAIGILLCRPNPTSNTMLPLPINKRFAWLLLSLFLGLLLVSFLPNPESELIALSQAFYRTGALVFGGGHVVLPLLEEAVVHTGWISNEHFLAGYGAAQAIPGPMFAFSAYLGAMIPNEQSMSWLNALFAVVFIFLPGFLLLAATLPLWQFIANKPFAGKAIAGIHAAVVGILAAALINPIVMTSVMSAIDVLICIVAIICLVRWRLSPLLVVVWCIVASLAAYYS